MTVHITLNREALRKLIDEDQDFALNLKASVLSEIGKRFFDKSADRVIRDANPELFDQIVAARRRNEGMDKLIDDALRKAVLVAGRYNYSARALDPVIQKQVDEVVATEKARITRHIATQIEKAYSDVVKTAIEAELQRSDLEALIERRVNNITERHIDSCVTERVNEKLEAILNAAKT